MTYRWKVWTDDGRVFTSENCAPEDVPQDGFLGVREWFADGTTRRLPFEEYYEWTGDGWRAGDRADLEKWLRQNHPEIKFGRWASNSLWQRVRTAIAQTDW